MFGRHLWILAFTMEWFIEKFALRDRDLLFEGHKFKNYISNKR